MFPRARRESKAGGMGARREHRRVQAAMEATACAAIGQWRDRKSCGKRRRTRLWKV